VTNRTFAELATIVGNVLHAELSVYVCRFATEVAYRPPGYTDEVTNQVARQPIPRWLLFWAIALIVIGVFFRFYNLDRKLYSSDETTTSLHVSGHSLRDYESLVDGRIHSATEFFAFQHVNPTRGPSDVIRVLASEDPEHPPFYYVAEREWMMIAGNSIAARRALSALASVAAIGAAFWFGRELFGTTAPALAFAALVAISPFHVFYAQTAREYELWALMTLISSALLARSIRLGGWIDWTAYALAGAIALYTDVISLFVLFGQFVFVAITMRRERPRALVACSAAIACALAAFTPWLLIMIEDAKHHSVTKNAYTAALPIKLVVLKWAFIVGQTFMDLDYKYAVTAVVLPLIFAWIIVAFAILVRATPTRIWLHVVMLTSATALLLLLWDILKHDTVTTQSRYLVPTWLGIECAVGFLIAKLAEGESRRGHKFASTAAWAFALLGVASLTVSSQFREWYGGSGAGVPHQVDIIAEQRHTLIIFKDDQPAWDESPLVLSNYVTPDVQYEMIPRNGEPLAVTGQRLLTLDSTPQFRAQLKQRGYQLRQLYTFAEAGALAPLREQGKVVRREQGYVEYEPSLWALAPKHPGP
jgi:uncharacterized membrane protein